MPCQVWRYNIRRRCLSKHQLARAALLLLVHAVSSAPVVNGDIMAKIKGHAVVKKSLAVVVVGCVVALLE